LSLVSSSFALFPIIDSSAGSSPNLSGPDLVNSSARNPVLIKRFSLVSGAEQKNFPRARCYAKDFPSCPVLNKVSTRLEQRLKTFPFSIFGGFCHLRRRLECQN
jgi:hypothetical protein